jgi:hypothetical protein
MTAPAARARSPLGIGHLLVTGVVIAALALVPVTTPAASAADCSPGANPISCENTRPGNPPSEWDVGEGDDDITAFTTDISTNVGGTVRFKVNTTAPTFRVEIFRLGYYQGLGARKVATLPTANGTAQPACLNVPATGLIDCGNWSVSASWTVSADAVSGVHLAVLTRLDNGNRNMTPFVVRDDASHAAIVFQTSDTTWQAYNDYGGNSLYEGDPVGRAYKVSYNRPFNTRAGTPQGRDFLFSTEYPTIRWLERNGYDVAYQSGVDTDRHGSLLTNHRTFLSVGHDEYWSGAQRTNVEAARDAGVNLAFLSGNEVFWKTRYEPSIDGSSTAYRTLVTYKETRANAKIDPSSAWTGTWRDPRFSPPADGGRPENALTGTWYMVNCCNSAITVPDTDAQLRFWRHTSLQSLAPGEVATLAPNTLGYEFDEVADNGFQPAGLVPLSKTTIDTPEYLLDHGSEVGPGTATHRLVIHRAPSGALVFGAGTVQWAWGLDQNHDGQQAPADPRMQQATMNILADMDAQPTTPQPGLVPTPASTDHTAPTATIATPTSGETISGGATYAVTGTAADAGGGRVGSVEVSTDDGATWHPAEGRGTWTYDWRPNGVGAATLRVRSTDDSGNTSAATASVTVTRTCPCSLLADATPPFTAPSPDASAVSLGVKFRSETDGFISGVRFYKQAGNIGQHTGSLWSTSGVRLATGTFTNETDSGWQTLSFGSPVAISANTTYVASYYAPNGHYTATAGALASSIDEPPLHAPSSATSGGNGVFRYGSDGFPTDSFGAASYWVDPVFLGDAVDDDTPPTAQPLAPVAGATGVSVKVTPQVVFDEPVRSSSIQLTVTSASGTAVPGALAYDNETRTATFSPSTLLQPSTTYGVTVQGAVDLGDNAMSAPVSWSFTTSGDPAGCPCSLFEGTTPNATTAGDTAAVTLGMKFTSEIDGLIFGVRFYKGLGAGSGQTGSLWSANGVRLATGQFSNEAGSGWHTLTFAQPVVVRANTTYVATYFAPQGRYVASGSYFNQPVDRPPLHAPTSAASGGNGVYAYGGDQFPTSTYGATNYWVDPIFGNDLSPLVATPSVPAPGSNGISVKTDASVTFNRPVISSSVQLSLRSASGTVIAGATAYDPETFTATFDPNGLLSPSTTYTATLQAAQTAVGIGLTAPVSWSFTTSSDPNGCPCTLFDGAAPAIGAANDPSPITVGVKFRSDLGGWVSAVRFFKGNGNGGTHTGSLWSTAGVRLATGTFAGETTSGWQTLVFDEPVPIDAGTTYVASYFAPQGRYAASPGLFNAPVDNVPLHAPANGTNGGNGVYRYGSDAFPTDSWAATSYGVDVVVQLTPPPDVTDPVAVPLAPGAGATNVLVTSPVSTRFSEPVTTSTIAFTVTPATGPAIAGAVSYDAPAMTATFTPAAPLQPATTYTANVSGATDGSGNAMAPVAWSFTTTTATSGCPCTLFDTTTPPMPAANDGAALTVGVKFQSTTNGFVAGVRFYKGAGNGGVHTGSLFSADGTRLATGTFVNETTTGWQTLLFSQPVPVTAGTTYVAAYFAPQGRYAATGGFFANPLTRGPLLAPASGASGGNGVYRYGSDAFPNATFNSTNYWVDPIFTP